MDEMFTGLADKSDKEKIRVLGVSSTHCVMPNSANVRIDPPCPDSARLLRFYCWNCASDHHSYCRLRSILS